MARDPVQRAADEDLMDRYCAGEVPAFEELFRRYALRVTRFVTPLVGAAQAADVAQVALLKVHERRAQYRAGARFSTWLFTIAKHTALDVLRKPSSRRELADERAGHDTAADVSAANHRDPLADARVQAAVRRLPEEQRDVVLLHWFAEVPLDEAARSLGISHQAARARASRAYESLRTLLGGAA